MCDSDDCQCTIAASMTYERLRAQGAAEGVAFVVTASIYEHYHPGVTSFEALHAARQAIADTRVGGRRTAIGRTVAARALTNRMDRRIGRALRR